jgi:methylenetetrahydrofolate reductase (NADPH)
VLPSGLDAVVVADNPDAIHGSALACAALLAREGRTAVLSLTTRDRNRVALESEALGAASLDVSGILCLSGNHQSLGLCPQAASANDIDSIQLSQLIKGLDLPGLVLGATAHPSQRPLELNLLRLKKKVNAGAEFILTEPVFDLPAFAAWLDAVRGAELDSRTAIIASVLPLPSVERATELKEKLSYGPISQTVVDRLAASPDAAKEGLEMAAETAAKLKSLPGVRGIHILSGGAEALAGQLVQAAGLT